MNDSLKHVLGSKKCTIEEALVIFDQLPPVSLQDMFGQWRGFEISTGHPLDGLLVASGWYGKFFFDTEHVHPLLIYNWHRQSLFSINPLLIPMNIPLPKSRLAGWLMILLKPLLVTKKSHARLRLVEYRGKITATMIYDQKAIFDHFAKIDENTVLGVMDQKGGRHPYIFVLERCQEKDRIYCKVADRKRG